jgi:hypothetical protein
LLFQRFGKVPLRCGKFARALFELLLKIRRRGSTGAPGGRLLAALGPRSLFAERCHGCAVCRCADAASVVNAIDVTSGPRFIRPSQDGLRQRPKYTTCVQH